MADSTCSGEDMAPTKRGAKDGEENSLRSRYATNLSLLGEGRPLPLSPAASSAPNYSGDDCGRSVDSTCSGEEIAPTKTGANHGEKNFRRSSLAKNISLRGRATH